MQISFILNELKQHNLNIYNDLFKNYKRSKLAKMENFRMNDQKISHLKTNISKIKQNVRILNHKIIKIIKTIKIKTIKWIITIMIIMI